MSYRPITDIWFLTRARLKDGKKYYGAYLGGFPERARILLGVSFNDAVLHVCGGMAKYYPYKGFGPNDKTMDINKELNPDICGDATVNVPNEKWGAILIDPPYSEKDAEKYGYPYPQLNKLVKNSVDSLDIGKRVGVIHYSIPKLLKNTKFVACVGVFCGFNNRIRAFSVFEKIGGN